MNRLLQGQHGRLEKLEMHHAKSLWGVLHGADVWDYMAYGSFENEGEFNAFIEQISMSNDPYYYAIMKGNDAIGWATLMSFHAANRVMEVGNIVFSPLLQKTPLATEAIYLLSKEAFRLGTRRFEWKCNDLNAPSKRAALRYGFTYEGLFRQHMIVKGKNRDTAWFSMLDSEWEQRKAAFEAWLSLENFDQNGHQIKKLGA
jgi:RimJ/RimL family protein N-acetyltransferase